MIISSDNPAALALNIDRLMRRIHSELQQRAAQFDVHQVGPLGGMLLLTIAEHDSPEIQSVVDALGRDKSQVSRLIQRLERKGLLTRERSREDGRVFLLQLTGAGEDQLVRIKDVLSIVVGEMFSNLSKEESKAFSSMLERVLD